MISAVEMLIAGVFAGVAAILVFLCIASFSAEQKCLAHGWPRAKVDWAFNAYCVKRIDQTDVVRPLKEISP